MEKIGSFVAGFIGAFVLLPLLFFSSIISNLFRLTGYLPYGMFGITLGIAIVILIIFRQKISGGSFFTGFATAIGLTLLWFGTCFGIGIFGFNYGGRMTSLQGIIMVLAFTVPTILVLWLFIKILSRISKQEQTSSLNQ